MSFAPALRHLCIHARATSHTFHRHRPLTYLARSQVLQTCNARCTRSALLGSPLAAASSRTAGTRCCRTGTRCPAFSSVEAGSPLSQDNADLEWDKGEPQTEQALVLPPPSHSRVKTADFVKSSTAVSQCPPAKHPEFAVIGRSNVGKSSLINMLTGKKALAQISKTPGEPSAFPALSSSCARGENYGSLAMT